MPLEFFFSTQPHLEDQTASFAFGLGLTRLAVRSEFAGIRKGPVAGRAAIRRVHRPVLLGRL